MAPLRLGFSGGAGDAEATVLRRNNFSQPLRSPMSIYSDVNGEAGETCPGVEGRRVVDSSSSSGDDVVDHVNIKKDDLWKKFEHCSGCRWWNRRMCRGY
jgi:hypothetical protein